MQSVNQPILGPVVQNLLAKLTSLVDNRATTIIRVIYHEPKEEDPTPSPDESTAATISFFGETQKSGVTDYTNLARSRSHSSMPVKGVSQKPEHRVME